MAKLTTEEFIAAIKELSVLELNDLVSAIEEKFGVVAAAAVAAPAAAAEEAAGPSEVTVTLADVGATKVAVIKAVREITGLGLVDAKKLVDGVPAAIKENVSPEEAESIKEKLVAAGATVEIK